MVPPPAQKRLKTCQIIEESADSLACLEPSDSTRPASSSTQLPTLARLEEPPAVPPPIPPSRGMVRRSSTGSLGRRRKNTANVVSVLAVEEPQRSGSDKNGKSKPQQSKAQGQKGDKLSSNKQQRTSKKGSKQKNRLKPPPSNRRKDRKTSKSVDKKSSSDQAKRNMYQVRDVDETRLVNPLAEWPTQQHIQPMPPVNRATSRTEEDDDDDNDTQQFDAAPRPSAPVANAADLIPMLNLWLPIPDTYSLAYQARLLGFDVAVQTPICNATNSSASSSASSSARGNNNGASAFTPLPNPLRFMRETNPSQTESYEIIPPLGDFSTQIWHNHDRTTVHGSGETSLSLLDEDDTHILQDAVDPLYQGLCVPINITVVPPGTTKSVSGKGIETSISSSQHRTLATTFEKAKATIIDETLTHARSMLGSALVSPSWTICSWSDYVKCYEPPTSTATTRRSGGSNGFGFVLLPRALPTPPPAPSCEEEAVAQFEQQKAIPRIQPLVIVWYNFVWYHYDSQRAGMIMKIRDISVAPTVQVDAGGSVSVDNVSKKKDFSGSSFLEQVQVVLSLCGVLDHSRRASVVYATLDETPSAMREFWRVFFGMVEVAKSNDPLDPMATTHNSEQAEQQQADAQLPAESPSTATNEDQLVAAAAAAETSKTAKEQSPVLTPEQSKAAPDSCQMAADLNKSSSRLSLLLLKQVQTKNPDTWSVPTPLPREGRGKVLAFRSIVRFPNENEAVAMTKESPLDRVKRHTTRKPSNAFSSASQAVRQLTVAVRAKLPERDRNGQSNVQFARLDPTQQTDEVLIDPPIVYEEPPLEVLRTFSLPTRPRTDEPDDEILVELKKMQAEVRRIEQDVLEPKARVLMDQVVEERLAFEQSGALEKLEEEKRLHAEFRKIQAVRKADYMEQQKQLEQDMDAVCSICEDGEVTPDNQILFCDTCDVAVHQKCYGIASIPSGDYHCLACRHLGRDKAGRRKYLNKNKSGVLPLPIACEMCISPQKPGAFIRTNMPQVENPADWNGENGAQDDSAKFVHVVCSKWHGLDVVDKTKPDVLEDITELRNSFRLQGLTCDLCHGARGCLIKCNDDDCKRYVHITCARAVGTCEVNHGQNCDGEVVNETAWTLKCPEHSDSSKVPKNENTESDSKRKTFLTVEQLIEIARELPPEPAPKPKPKPVERVPFNKASPKQQKLMLEDPVYEKDLIHELTNNRSSGLLCEVCEMPVDSQQLVRCRQCRETVCRGCIMDGEPVSEKCVKCKSESKPDEEMPKCIACNASRGPLRQCFAKPVTMGTWNQKRRKKEFERSLFTRAQWIHSLCAHWYPKVFFNKKEGKMDLVNVIMAHGRGFIDERKPCAVCGIKFGLKIQCCRLGCNTYFHLTCARQVGLEVKESTEGPYAMCYRHVGNEFNIRARLEDLFEIEKVRKKSKPLNFIEAARMMNASLSIVRTLGWAWRWAEWWVDYDQSWEPLLEPGQKEEDMTKEELRIVDSTRESRCEDARRCRLTALGAALRNRYYDKDENDFDRESLDRALRAFLSTKSLVGPLGQDEIDFHVEWLGRAYRSKSKLLMVGDDKIPVDQSKESFCFVGEGDSRRPKFDIDPSKIPGKVRPATAGEIFERQAEDDVDEFLKTTIIEDAPIHTKRPHKRRGETKRRPGRPKKQRVEDEASVVDDEQEDIAPEVPKRRGRPPKNPPAEASVTQSQKTRRNRAQEKTGESNKKSEEVSYYRNYSTPSSRRRGRLPINSAIGDHQGEGEGTQDKPLAQLLAVGHVWRSTAKKTGTTSKKRSQSMGKTKNDSPERLDDMEGICARSSSSSSSGSNPEGENSTRSIDGNGKSENAEIKRASMTETSPQEIHKRAVGASAGSNQTAASSTGRVRESEPNAPTEEKAAVTPSVKNNANQTASSSTGTADKLESQAPAKDVAATSSSVEKANFAANEKLPNQTASSSTGTVDKSEPQAPDKDLAATSSSVKKADDATIEKWPVQISRSSTGAVQESESKASEENVGTVIPSVKKAVASANEKVPNQITPGAVQGSQSKAATGLASEISSEKKTEAPADEKSSTNTTNVHGLPVKDAPRAATSGGQQTSDHDTRSSPASGAEDKTTNTTNVHGLPVKDAPRAATSSGEQTSDHDTRSSPSSGAEDKSLELTKTEKKSRPLVDDDGVSAEAKNLPPATPSLAKENSTSGGDIKTEPSKGAAPEPGIEALDDVEDDFGFKEISDEQNAAQGKDGESAQPGARHDAAEPNFEPTKRRRSGRTSESVGDDPTLPKTTTRGRKASGNSRRSKTNGQTRQTSPVEEGDQAIKAEKPDRKRKRSGRVGKGTASSENSSSRPQKRPRNIPNEVQQITDALSTKTTSKRKRTPPQRFTVEARSFRLPRNGEAETTTSTTRRQTKKDERKTKPDEATAGLNSIHAIKMRRRSATDRLGMVATTDDQDDADLSVATEHKSEEFVSADFEGADNNEVTNSSEKVERRRGRKTPVSSVANMDKDKERYPSRRRNRNKRA